MAKLDGIGSRIKELRADHLKLTQRDFSELLGTTQANISQIESNFCRPTGDFIHRLAEKVKDLNFNWLIYGEGSPKRSVTMIEEVKKVRAEVEKDLEKKHKLSFAKINDEMAEIRNSISKIQRTKKAAKS